MRYKCDACGKMIKDKFIFGLVHYCFPLTEDYRIKNNIMEVSQLNEDTDELEHRGYYNLTHQR